MNYLAGRVFVHKWPKDSPEWDDSVRERLDDSINKNPEEIPVTISDESVLIGNIKFHSLKKIGISVPFFKEECAMIFEAGFGSLSGHVHVHIRSKDYVKVFNALTSWKDRNFPDD